ncbi:hypothetical protein C7964_10768 [Loktanella sp. PT4BL]|jgi:hypothetical protein|uniref:hypothetical protein n=1 Tax=Loktanella sp. PT4BL TaxID=2135611 RepID=UPI000D76C332|nr:hypothetical protein [Loktanella sp. PT4BL]PXW67349.1 hypothetical protein C7964_10768 [Loktanella sp. PT4BL]
MNDGTQDLPSGAPSEERPFAVQTFTARYDPAEDRIFLNAVDATGAKQAIYLTRRLMDQIIPIVAKHLEEKTPKGVPADVVQSMTQERVRQARKAEPPAEPVQADLETPRWLCTMIQMSKQPAGLAVTLTGEAACKAQIPLADPHLRTVLDIFRNSYARAGWDLRVFPEWLGSAKAAAGQGAQVRLN